MPMNPKNTQHTYRTVFAGMTETVTLLKRGDDQAMGTITAYTLYKCRRSKIHKTGELIQGDMTANHRTIWHIPRVQLDKVGVKFLSAADRIVQTKGREKGWTWQPEATTMIDLKLLSNEFDLHCLRTDPPIVAGS